MSFGEGYSVGLFLDQRDNRRRLLAQSHRRRLFSLGSSVEDRFRIAHSPSTPSRDLLCHLGTSSNPESVRLYLRFLRLRRQGRRATTSLDLSKKYLEWGKRNFALNRLDPAEHDFIYGDVFDWLRRLAKKGRSFAPSRLILQPSRNRKNQVCFARKGLWPTGVRGAAVARAGGVLFASTNAAEWPPEAFLADVETAVAHAEAKHPSEPLRSATAGFSRLTKRTGLFEDGVAAGWMKAQEKCLESSCPGRRRPYQRQANWRCLRGCIGRQLKLDGGELFAAYVITVTYIPT